MGRARLGWVIVGGNVKNPTRRGDVWGTLGKERDPDGYVVVIAGPGGDS